jgi:hypothetical protein
MVARLRHWDLEVRCDYVDVPATGKWGKHIARTPPPRN